MAPEERNPAEKILPLLLGALMFLKNSSINNKLENLEFLLSLPPYESLISSGSQANVILIQFI